MESAFHKLKCHPGSYVCMPFDYHTVHGGKGRIWIAHGVISGVEMIARNDRIFNSKLYRDVFWLFVDHTGTTSLELSPEEIQIIRHQDDRLATVLPEIVTVVLVPSDLGFGMTRMWEILTERPGWSIRAFRTRPEAEAWLRQEVLLKFGLELPTDLNAP